MKVNSLATAAERLVVRAGYLRDLPLRLPRQLARVLGREQLPQRSEFAQLRPGLRLLIISLAGCVALIAAVTILAVLSVEVSTMSLPAWLAPRATSAATVDRRSRMAVENNISQRPLFSRGRKSVAVAAPAATPAAAPQLRDENLKLKGVFIDGRTAKAFMTSTETPFGIWVAVNGIIGGWRIASVTPNQVELGANDEKRVLILNTDGAPHAGVSAAAKEVRSSQPIIYGPRQNPNQMLMPPQPGGVIRGR
jgi:hypothetical protein